MYLDTLDIWSLILIFGIALGIDISGGIKWITGIYTEEDEE